jgi:hypothetical protein
MTRDAMIRVTFYVLKAQMVTFVELASKPLHFQYLLLSFPPLVVTYTAYIAYGY